MKKKKYIGLILVLFISIGFAILTSNLNIGGTASFSDASFNVHFENAKVEKSAVDNATITINENQVSINSSGTFEKPGDYIDTSFYVMNTGTMDARLDTLTVSGISTELSEYFTYTLKYDWNKTNVNRNDVLRAGQGRKINLHIEYKYNVEQLTTATNLSLTVTMNYINPKNAITDTVWNYEYTGGEQVFYVNKSGNYKLEAWGAQGGDASSFKGGYGAYSTGTISLNKTQKFYLNIGNKPSISACGTTATGGYNGGAIGITLTTNDISGAGGGATSIALSSGLIKDFENSKEQLIIVSGGGGGAYFLKNRFNSSGGSAGGITGGLAPWDGDCDGRQQKDGIKASQSEAGTASACGTKSTLAGFGVGGVIENYLTIEGNRWFAGGGSGFYGGGAGYAHGANGGSSYIGNINLTNKAMYCYNCEESSEESTKTVSTTNVSENPTSNYAKIGNGFVRITYLGK